MDKNRIGGIRRRASKQRIAKPISIKVAGCRSGGCARKAVELTSGDLRCVEDFRLKTPQGVLRVFKPAPILDSGYSAIVNLDRCASAEGISAFPSFLYVPICRIF